MTMQRTHNRRRRHLLSRSIRRNPWTRRGYRRENVLKHVIAITRKMLEYGNTPFPEHRRLTSMAEAESLLKRGAIVCSPLNKMDINQDGTIVCHYPAPSQEASVSYVDTDSGPYKSDPFSQELGSTEQSKEE